MCIFCDIINGKIPSSKVYEDENVLAILDVSQVTFGHTLVMPKKHVDNIVEADDETVEQCAKVISHLTKQIVKNTGAKGCNVLNNCGEIAGQTVNHLHFHIIPRYSNKDAVTFQFNPSEKQDLNVVLEKVKG